MKNLISCLLFLGLALQFNSSFAQTEGGGLEGPGGGVEGPGGDNGGGDDGDAGGDDGDTGGDDGDSGTDGGVEGPGGGDNGDAAGFEGAEEGQGPINVGPNRIGQTCEIPEVCLEKVLRKLKQTNRLLAKAEAIYIPLMDQLIKSGWVLKTGDRYGEVVSFEFSAGSSLNKKKANENLGTEHFQSIKRVHALLQKSKKTAAQGHKASIPLGDDETSQTLKKTAQSYLQGTQALSAGFRLISQKAFLARSHFNSKIDDGKYMK